MKLWVIFVTAGLLSHAALAKETVSWNCRILQKGQMTPDLKLECVDEGKGCWARTTGTLENREFTITASSYYVGTDLSHSGFAAGFEDNTGEEFAKFSVYSAFSSGTQALGTLPTEFSASSKHYSMACKESSNTARNP